MKENMNQILQISEHELTDLLCGDSTAPIFFTLSH